MRRKFILLLILAGVPLLTFSQILTLSNPSDFVVCSDGILEISIQNTDATPLSGGSLQLILPCTVEYQSGTVTGAQEGDISDLNQPNFDLADIPANGSLTIQLTLNAPCSIQNCIDNGDIFEITANLNYSGGSVSTTGEPFVIETPLLVITSVNDPVMSGTQGQILTRTIRIRNTRLGSVSTFTFTDNHDPGISISTNLGTDISPTPTMFIAELSGSDFSGIGDGDALFEFNEEIILEEQIQIDSCSFDRQSVLSELFLSWGCNGEICATPIPNQLVVIDIELNPDLGPIIEFTPMVGDPDCLCGDERIPQALSIRNTDNFSSATSFWLELNQSILGSSIPEGPIRLVNGNDTTVIDADFLNPSDQDCLAENTFNNLAIRIPNIDPGQQLILLWESVFCFDEGCANNANLWNFSYNYFKSCAAPGDGYHSGNSFGSGTGNGLLSSFLPINTLMDGDLTEGAYIVQSELLDEASGELILDLQIPCGLILENNDWELGGQLPTSTSIERLGTINAVALRYPLPLSTELDTLFFPMQFLCDSLCEDLGCKDTLITSCTDLCTPQGFIFQLEGSVGIQADASCPLACIPESCAAIFINFDCPVEVCADTILGYAEQLAFSFERINFGLPDSDDDFDPDPGDPLDFNLIRTDRAMTGDTLRLVTNSVVRIDEVGTTYVNALLDFGLGARCSSPNFPPCNPTALLTPGSGLLNYYNEVRIYDNSSGQSYICNQVPQIVPGTPDYSYDISVAALLNCGNVPIDFRYDDGDSISVVAFFKINHNLAYVNTSNYINPRTALLTAAPSITLYNQPVLTDEEDFNCGCSSLSVDITGYGINNPGNLISLIPKCKAEETTGAREVFSVNLRFNNFFPYEFRPISQLLKWTHSTHPSFELTRLHVESFSNNGQAIFQSESLPFTDQGTFYESSFLDLVPDLLDESYQVVLSMDYLTAPCGLDEPEIQLDRTYCYEVVDGYDELQSEYTFARRYGPIEPELHLNTTLCDVTSFDSRVAWRLEFDNTTSLTNSTPELTAFYPWLQPISPSGLIGDFSLVNLETGTSYPLVNGIFQLDTLFNLDTVRLELRGINQSCIQEPIEFRYGWDCAPYTNPIDDPCVAESLTCSVLSPPGVIDMQANPMAISAPLCDTMEWLEVEVFDAGLGAVYNLQLEVQLPPGMTIPNGVSQIAYPAESNNYLPVGDPQDLGNGLYRWILTEEVDTLQTFGLPGVNRAPENALSLRFKALTDCDFIAGSFALYSASAEEVCDRPTNSVAKIGEPMNIDGVTPPYTTTITTSTTGNPACTDSLQLEVRVNSLTPFGTADSLIIQLPPGIVYEDLSCTGSLPDCTPFVAGNLLLWVLPPGAQSLDLEIGLLGFQSLDCQDLTFPIYTTNTVNANCAALGQSCGLRVLTGSRTVAVGLDRPIFTISNLPLRQFPDKRNASILVST